MKQEKTIHLSVPNGYRIMESFRDLLLSAALTKLDSREQRRYTKAYRFGSFVRLTKHSLICPSCGQRTPAYQRYLAGEEYKTVPPLTRSEIFRWLANTSDSILGLNELYAPKIFHCPHCRCDSVPYTDATDILIRPRGKKIYLSTLVTDLIQLMKLHDRFYWDSVYPVREELELNLRRGRLVLRLWDVGGKLLAIRDVTEEESLLEASVIYRMMNHRLVRRKLRQLLQKIWETPIPFTAAEMDRDRIVQTVRFRNYPRSFYNGIPYLEGTQHILHGLFDPGKLHDGRRFPDVVMKTSDIPQIKSIRRILYRDPGLIWYHREIGILWETIKDPNILSTLLLEKNAYRLLAFLHMYPGGSEFIRDYVTVKGNAGFLKILRKNLVSLEHYAARYSTMSPSCKAMEQKKWLQGEKPNAQVTLPVNLPVFRQRSAIPDSWIDGYYFAWVRSTNDFIEAGRVLENCLSHWRYNGIILVRNRNLEICGAVELDDSCVIQAETKQNRGIYEDPPLGIAFNKWVERFRLSLQGVMEPVEDDYDLELCF